ncbi:YhgE/Pip domain-containing protein [Sporosarcina sp. D27]|uniref:YhgE/Pip domain-containing protein n=1 Tax=Sporosarcina sp. D27 TaxID=1382305 RepID=UPI00046F5F1D|nr:ABC transporter permease [Sporosarcina sp. D27]
MNVLKQKLIFISPIVILAVITLFSLTMIPSVSPSPKELPIALVNEDSGVSLPDQTQVNMGKQIIKKIQSQSGPGEVAPVKWISVDSLAKAQTGMKEKDYYAAFVIPKSFSENQLSLQTPKPASPEIELYINQGMNSLAANAAGQILDGIVDGVNEGVRSQLLSSFSTADARLTAEQAELIVEPIHKKVINVNQIGTKSANGNAPVSLFQPVWMASIGGAVLVFFALQKSFLTGRKQKAAGISAAIGIGAIMAVLAGFWTSWFANSVIGLAIPNFSDTALFISLAYFTYFLLILAVLSWLGMKGIPIFVLTLFFGLPLLAMPKEFMSSFYQDWVNPWLPMRPMIDGLRDLLFFGKGFEWSHSVEALTFIALGSLLLLCSSVFKKERRLPEQQIG